MVLHLLSDCLLSLNTRGFCTRLGLRFLSGLGPKGLFRQITEMENDHGVKFATHHLENVLVNLSMQLKVRRLDLFAFKLFNLDFTGMSPQQFGHNGIRLVFFQSVFLRHGSPVVSIVIQITLNLLR